MRGDSNGLSDLSGPTYSPAEWFPVHLIKSADTLRHHTLSCQRKWLYTGLGRKLEAREKMKRPSVNGVPNVPNLLVSFFVAQKEVANSKLHIPMNDTHFILNQKYFRNLKKRSKYCLFSSTDKIFSFSKYFPSLSFFSPACGPNIFFLFLPLYSSQQYIAVHQ